MLSNTKKQLIIPILFLSICFLLLKQVTLAEEHDRLLLLLHCTRCHSEKLIDQQHLNKKDWDNTLLWMETKHNLIFPSPAIRKKILNYLGKYHGPTTEKNVHPMGLRPVNPLPK